MKPDFNKIKVIDNKIYCHKLNVFVEDDDYGVFLRYKDWAECSLEEAINGIFNYSMRIIRNIIKYHHNYDNIESLIDQVAIENNFDIKRMKSDQSKYQSFYKNCQKLCEKRCEYTPYERSYWYDILVEMHKTFSECNNYKTSKPEN